MPEPIQTTPLSIGEKLKQNANIEVAKAFDPQQAVYNVGKGRSFSGAQHNVDRYLSYGTDVYGKLGFDPFDNKLEQKYIDNTSALTDVKRGLVGAWKLAGVGFSDTFGLGAFASDTNYKDFDKTMQTYSSSRGGGTQFFSNTLLSSGYTAGIIAGIAAEEIGIGLATGGVGLLGSGGMVGAQLAKGFSRLNKGQDYIQAARELSDINKARTFLNRSGDWAKRSLNPVGETVDFVKNIDKIKDFSGLQQTALGAGAVVRDMRKILLTDSESKLEANLARDEFKKREVEEWYKENPGKDLSDADFSKIENAANQVYQDTYMGNVGLIYLTNAITFDNAFKNMRLSNSWLQAGQSGMLRITGKGTVNATVEALERNLGNSIRAWGSHTFNAKNIGKGFLKSAPGASMEGVQELGQDIISTAASSYHSLDNKGRQIRGNYLSNIFDAAGDRIFSMEGLETFASGALMGAFASPVSFASSQISKNLSMGGIQKAYQKYFQSQKFAEQNKKDFATLQEKAKVLTELFRDPKAYVDFVSKPAFTQSSLQEKMLDAAERKDKKGFEDLREQSFAQGIETMLKYGIEGEYAQHLSEMAQGFNVEEMNQALGRKDVTDENIDEFRNKLLDRSNTIKNYRKVYDQINENFTNPYSLSGVDTKDPKNVETVLNHYAFENLKRELLFSHGKLANWATRMKELKTELSNDLNMSSLDVHALLDRNSLDQAIELLRTEVSANKGLEVISPQLKDSAEKAEKKLEALTAYKKAYDTYTKLLDDSSIDSADYDEAYEEMFTAFNDYASISSNALERPEVQRSMHRRSFDNFFDYISMGEDIRQHQSLVNTLMDPSSASIYVGEQKEMFKRLLANKEDDILNSLKSFEEKKESSKMLEILYDLGMFFNLNELDDLVNKGVMPSVIYDLTTQKPVSPEQLRKAEDVISKFYKNLKGRTIHFDTRNKNIQTRFSKRRGTDTRTVNELLRNYGVELEKTYDLSEKKNRTRILGKVLGGKYLEYIDKQLLDASNDVDFSVQFTLNGDQPLSFKDGVMTIDLRYAGAEYRNAQFTFESLIASAFSQVKLMNNLNKEEYSDVAKEVETLMSQARDAYAKEFGTDQTQNMSVFSSTSEFLNEALSNPSFQKFLGNIQDKTIATDRSVWRSFMNQINRMFNKVFDKTLLNRAVSLANVALNEAIVDNINELESEVEITSEEISFPDSLEEQIPATVEERLIEERQLLDSINDRLNKTGKLSFRRRLRLNAVKTEVLIRINDLEEELAQESVQFPEDVQVAPIDEIVEEETTDSGDVVLNERTPFEALPESLQKQLVDLYTSNLIQGLIFDAMNQHAQLIDQIKAYIQQRDSEGAQKALKKLQAVLPTILTAEIKGTNVLISGINSVTLSNIDYDNIQKLIGSDLNFQKLISEHNKNQVVAPEDIIVLAIDDVSEEELQQQNRDAINAAKDKARTERLQRQQEDRERKRATRSGRKPVSQKNYDELVELIKDLVKDDFALLTSQDIDGLIDKLRNSNDLFPFRVPDILSFVAAKKATLQRQSERELTRLIYQEELNKIKDERERALAEERYEREVQEMIQAEEDLMNENRNRFLSTITGKKSFIVQQNGQQKAVKFKRIDFDVFYHYNKKLFRTMDFETLVNKMNLDIQTAKYHAKSIQFVEQSRDKLHNELLNKVVAFDNTKGLYPVLANAINKALYNVGSDFMLLRSKTPIVSIYTIESGKVQKRTAPQTQYKKNVQSIKDNLENFTGETLAEALVVLWFANGGKINPKLLDKLYRGKVEKQMRASLVDKSSKQVSSDGLADLIFEDYLDYFPSDFSGMDVVESVLHSGYTVTEMVNNFMGMLPTEENEFDIEYDLLADQQAMQQEYAQSKAYAIEFGIFNPTPENLKMLTPGEKVLFEFAKDSGLYSDSEKGPEVEEDAFMKALKEDITPLTQIEQTGSDLLLQLDEIRFASDRSGVPFKVFDSVKSMLNQAANDMLMASAFYKLSITSFGIPFSNAQKNTIKELVATRFRKGYYDNQYFVLNNEMYQLSKVEGDVATLLFNNGTESVFMPIDNMIDGMERILEPGDVFTKVDVNTKVDVQEIDDIKNPVKQIFGNFTNTISEVENVEDLNDQIIEQLTNCK